MSDYPKQCACGRCYSRDEWRTLPLVGHQRYELGLRLELRNCACKSTIAIAYPGAVRIAVLMVLVPLASALAAWGIDAAKIALLHWQ